MLELLGIEVRFGDVTAVDGIDLSVADGEILSVLGPSGSGKSTLLRAIAGLEQPERGRVAWDGRDLADTPTHRRQMGLMFQDHALFPHRDVLGNVLFGLRMQGMARPDAEARARQMVALVGLGGLEHRRIVELSGGEQQRVALARALAPAPRVLMLDEPLGSLDRALRERLMLELRELLTGLGVTTIYVTHDHDEAFALADRVAIMREGRIEQLDSPVEVWRSPATEFVARFLGYNITDALGEGRIGVRPDGLVLGGAAGIDGTVLARTFRRDHFLLRVQIGTSEPLEVAVAGDDVPAVGARVRVEVDEDAIVRFDESD